MKSVFSSLELLLPGLFENWQQWIQAGNQTEGIPALGWLIKQARSDNSGLKSFEQVLWRAFDPGISTADELPVGQLRAGMSDGFFVAVDLVHMAIAMQQVQLLGPSDLQLEAGEAAAVQALLQPHLSQEGIELYLDSQGSGWLHVPADPAMSTTPLSQVMQTCHALQLPVGADVVRWHRLSNEIQMLLHDAPFNQQREAQGLKPVNALWLWGAGVIQRPFRPIIKQVLADHELANLLAVQSSVPVTSIPDSFSELMKSVMTDRPLLVLDTLFSPYLQDDFLTWNARLLQLEQAWFKPLRQALQKGEIAALTLLGSNGQCFYLRARKGWQLWRNFQG
jgi:hypothetical protein